jgi:HD superfamily phosphohydrolase
MPNRENPMKEMTHRDDVHGDVRFDRLAVALLDSEPLQRLGRIYQLGYAHLVFRGGNHTRLSHVMGTYHVADQLVELLRRNYDGPRTRWPRTAAPPNAFLPNFTDGAEDDCWDALRHMVRWAALLHDIGHVPLGHTLEDEFDSIYVKHDDLHSPRMPALWNSDGAGRPSVIRDILTREELLPSCFARLRIKPEAIWKTVMLICLYKLRRGQGTESERFLAKINEAHQELTHEIDSASKDARLAFLQLIKNAHSELSGKIFFPFMTDIVANTICADYLDYLRRDARNLGLDVLKDDRVISHFWVGRDRANSLHMALTLMDRRGKPRLDTSTGVVELVRQRFRYAEIVYYHKTKVSASAMFAKVLHLIGKPEELVPAERTVVTPAMIDPLAREFVSRKSESKLTTALARGRARFLPASLLDPEIGDESLHLHMHHTAWRQIEAAAQAGDEQLIVNGLRAISLLQAITRRRLYKTCFSLDQRAYGQLRAGSKEGPAAEQELQLLIKELRKSPERRSAIEVEMGDASGLAVGADGNRCYDPFLMYVPPRKSQAKGIETGALDRDGMVTLGDHSAVSADVQQLSSRYATLWRLIILVHPMHANDSVALSGAVDTLLTNIFPGLDLHDYAVIGEIARCAWFDYIPLEKRSTARRYSDLATRRGKGAIWRNFDRVNRTCVDGVSAEEYVLRALLMDHLAPEYELAEEAANALAEGFPGPEDVTRKVHALRTTATIEGARGATEDDAVLWAVRELARELRGVAQPELFGD